MGIENGIALIGIIITIFLALMGLAYGYGALNNRVKTNAKDIDGQGESIRRYQAENKADHREITSKLDKILQNGAKTH